MNILINESNEIISYAKVGGLENGIEIDDTIIPVDFEQKFLPKLYVWKDNLIVLNGNYAPPVLDETPESPNNIEILEQKVNQSEQDLADLIYQLIVKGLI